MEAVIIGGIGDVFKNMLDGYEDELVKIRFIKRVHAKNYIEITSDLSLKEATEHIRKIIKQNPNTPALSYMFESDLNMYYDLAQKAKNHKNKK